MDRKSQGKLSDLFTYQIIDDNKRKKKGCKIRVPHSIKYQAAEKKYNISMFNGNDKIYDQEHRKKPENKF